MAGLKKNFNKSEVMTINDEENWASVYAEIFNCQIGAFPIKYIWVPVSPSRLHVIDWAPLLDKSNKKTRCVERKFLIYCRKENLD